MTHSFTNYPSSGPDEGIVQDLTPPAVSGSVADAIWGTLKRLYNKFASYLPLTGGTVGPITTSEVSFTSGGYIEDDGNGGIIFEDSFGDSILFNNQTVTIAGSGGEGTLSTTNITDFNTLYFGSDSSIQDDGNGGINFYADYNTLNYNSQVGLSPLFGPTLYISGCGGLMFQGAANFVALVSPSLNNYLAVSDNALETNTTLNFVSGGSLQSDGNGGLILSTYNADANLLLNSYTITFNGGGNISDDSIGGINIANQLTLQPISSAPSSPTEGMTYYDATAHALKVYTNAGWKTVTLT